MNEKGMVIIGRKQSRQRIDGMKIQQKNLKMDRETIDKIEGNKKGMKKVLGEEGENRDDRRWLPNWGSWLSRGSFSPICGRLYFWGSLWVRMIEDRKGYNQLS